MTITELAILKQMLGGSGSGGGKARAFGSLTATSLAWESGEYIPVYLIPKGYETYKITHPNEGTVILTKAQLEVGTGKYDFSSGNYIERVAILSQTPYYDSGNVSSDYYGISIWHSYMDGEYYNSLGTLYLIAE